MTDLSVYQPPGVYVQDRSQPYADILNPVLADQVLCIVAPALGHQAATETMTLESATATALLNPGVLQDDTLTVTTLSGTPLVLNTDYTVTVDSSDPDAPVTSLTRLPSAPETVSPNGLANGGGVRVSYSYTSTDYYQPHLFSDFSSLTQMYGSPMSTDQTAADPINSPLSFAAQCAFENGASQIICIAVKGTDATTWKAAYAAAYAKIVTNPSVGVLVPIFPESFSSTSSDLNAFLIDVRSHVNQAYGNGNARMVIASGGASFDEKTQSFDGVARAVTDKRVVLSYPTKLQTYYSAGNRIIEVGGGYGAAALAGRLMLNPVERGLTGQVLNTLTGIPAGVRQAMSRDFMNNLASSGTTVIMVGRNSRLTVRHGVTTDPSTQINREISIVRIGDTLLVHVQQALDNAGLIGSPITNETPGSVKAILVGALEQEIARRVILNYANVTVRQQNLPSGDPTVIECRFAYKPAAPLNYITVQFSLDMNLGTITSVGTDATQGTGATPTTVVNG